MAKSKKMNENAFAKLVKEFNSVGEVILTRQNEKQSVMDDFDAERVRYKKGRISEDTLASSAKKTNVELMRLDKNIRDAIVKVRKISIKMKEFAARQAPIVFRASVSGVKSASRKTSKKTVKKKAKGSAPKVKVSKTQLAKEKALDKKFSK